MTFGGLGLFDPSTSSAVSFERLPSSSFETVEDADEDQRKSDGMRRRGRRKDMSIIAAGATKPQYLSCPRWLETIFSDAGGSLVM